MEYINALLVYPGRRPELVLLENNETCIQGVIGSPVMSVCPWGDNVHAIFAKGGEQMGLEANRLLTQKSNSFIPLCPVFGPMLLCASSSKSETGRKYQSLTADQYLEYLFRFAVPDEISKDPKTGKRIWKVQQMMPFQRDDNESEE